MKSVRHQLIYKKIDILFMRKTVLLSIFSLLIIVQSVSAGVTLWYDNFERASLSPWVRTSPLDSEPTFTGGYLLLYNSYNYVTTIERSASGLGLNGDDWTYKIDWYWESGGNTYSYFQTEIDTTDGGFLIVKMYPAGNWFYIDYYNSTVGYVNIGGTAIPSFSTGKWYQLIISKSDLYINISNQQIGFPTTKQEFVFPNDLGIGGVDNVKQSTYPNHTAYATRIDNSILTSQCFNITSAGTYTFSDDTTIYSANDCIYIKSSNVNLNFNNFSMYGCGNPYTTGVYQDYYGASFGCGTGSAIVAQNVNNITIINVANAIGSSKIYGWNTGLSFSNVNSAYVYAMNFANGRVDCNNCQYVQFYGNNFGGNDLSPAFYGTSKYNVVGNAIFYNAYGLGVFWDANCQYNKMCNILYAGTQTYTGKPFADYSTPVDGIFTNTYDDQCPAGTPNILFSAPCSGSVGFDCVNSQRFWKDAWCNWLNITQCPYGCAGLTGNCASQSSTAMNTTPYANISIGLPAELSWIDYLVSPPILISIFVFGIAGLIASKIGGEKKGLIFLVTALIIFFILTITGTIPIWILIIFGLIGGVLLWVLMTKHEGSGSEK